MARKATSSTTNETAVVISPVKIESTVITIAGDTPLIIHSWSEKAKKEILDAQQGKKKGKKADYRNPVAEFIRSLYWLDGAPEIPEEAKEEECEEIFNKAIKSGARFGFPAVAVKAAAVAAAYRQGLVKNKVSANGSFFINGVDDDEFIEIESNEPPIMREDMVKIGMGTSDLRYRGEFKQWKANIKITYIKDGVFSLENIINMINLGGFSCGLGEWRIEKGGLNGAFHVEATKKR